VTDSSTGNTLADIFAGALTGYVDAQNQQPVYVTQPVPNTAFGFSGIGQPTPANSLAASLGNSSGLLMLGLLAVVAVVLLRR
jgi:hypothetical protein